MDVRQLQRSVEFAAPRGGVKSAVYAIVVVCCVVCYRDVLLLEAGLLTVLVAPLNLLGLQRDVVWHRCHDSVSMMLVRWLLFRLTFASGAAKLVSAAAGHSAWSLDGQSRSVAVLRWGQGAQALPKSCPGPLNFFQSNLGLNFPHV